MLGLHFCVWVFSGFSEGEATLRCGLRASRGGFSCFGAQALSEWASVAVAYGLSCSAACGILSDQGLNLRPLHWQANSLSTVPPRSLRETLFEISCKEASNLQSLYHMWLIRSSFPDQVLNLGPWQWKRGVLTTGPSGNSLFCFLYSNSWWFQVDFNPLKQTNKNLI